MPSLLSRFRSLLGYTIPLPPLALFFDAFAAQLNAGAPLAASLISCSTYCGDNELRDICAEIAPRITRGESVTSCFRPYSHRFPELVLSLLEVGEISGGLADAARRIADTFNQTLAIERGMRNNVYDPKLYLVGFCLIQLYVLLGPAIMAVQLGKSAVSVSLQLMLTIGMPAVQVVIIYLAVRKIMRIVYRWRKLRIEIDRIKLALPQLGQVSRNLSTARWVRSFGVLFGAGVNIATALEVSSRSALNAYYEEELMRAAFESRHGRPISKSLSKTVLLPPHLLSIIATSEETGRLDEHLIEIATTMERDALGQAIMGFQKIVLTVLIILFLIELAH